ncbi:MAG: adenylate/guanylate cyclase domain-containing protein [Nitrospirae bacterium]|nr:adenylate/guanylate cyclase domain-containing protein [Candidatus Manganitrophaceae bacterium]
MKIQRRLGLSFLLILILYGVNLGLYAWGNQKRSVSVEVLQKALSRQVLFSSIKQKLSNIQKEVTLLSQVMAALAAEGLGVNEIKHFRAQTALITSEIDKLGRLSEAEMSREIKSFEEIYLGLSQSWQIFYENFGINHAKAIAELAVRADPVSTHLMVDLLPRLYEEEQMRVETAVLNYYQVEAWAKQMTRVIFLLTILITLTIAFFTSRYISLGLSKLKEGAARIGSGTLHHRIDIQSQDELGDLATSFNEMGQNLLSTQEALNEAHETLENRHQEAEKQRQNAESLLLNILPQEIAQELKTKDRVAPKYFEDVSILFTDFVGFTASTEKLAVDELVLALHDYFTAFDQISERYGLEKLKTIGDSYMCVAGLPQRKPSHPVDAILAAFEMIDAVKKRQVSENPAQWSVRIGIHTGAVIAGVVGIQKFSFDIWGDSVNYAKRMESRGISDRINISDRTYARVKDFFACTHRRQLSENKEKTFEMYLVDDILPGLKDAQTLGPSLAFSERYQLYFQRPFSSHWQKPIKNTEMPFES